MTVNKKKFPPCFGKIANVFPMGKDGLREVPESCIFCYYKTNCMKTAVNEDKEGINVKKEITDRAYSFGAINFFQRWSRLKDLKQHSKFKKFLKK